MEKREFMLWATNKKGWLAAEATTEWAKYENDQTVERDHGGLQGSLRLWIDKKHVRLTDSTRTVTAEVVQGSNVNKKTTNKDIAILQAHLPKVPSSPTCWRYSIITPPVPLGHLPGTKLFVSDLEHLRSGRCSCFSMGLASVAV